MLMLELHEGDCRTHKDEATSQSQENNGHAEVLGRQDYFEGIVTTQISGRNIP
jgi:hypothetical protein